MSNIITATFSGCQTTAWTTEVDLFWQGNN